MKRLWRLFLAYTRLDLKAVCEMSVGRPRHADFHDYPDAVEKFGPMHFVKMHCRRCGKEFTI